MNIRQEGDPILRARAGEVTGFNSVLANLATMMLATMRESGGQGLAAPQVGVSTRLIVAERDGRTLVMANPVVVRRSGTRIAPEGCLSVSRAHWGRSVSRSASVWVTYKDLEGVDQTAKARGEMAACLQHEINHLDGILFTDFFPAGLPGLTGAPGQP